MAKVTERIFVYVGVMLFSAMVSLYVVFANDIINKDGILYIDVATAFLDHGLRGAYECFSWPFFGILIAVVHNLTGLNLENSAYLLNAALLMILCSAFVLVYEDVSGSDARAWVAAALILSFPILNDYRGLIVRDFGFWAFMMMGLHFFINFSRNADHMGAVKWQLSLLVAILFRVEGIAFLVLAPIFLLFRGEGLRKSAFHILQLNSLILFLVFVGVLAACLWEGGQGLIDSSTFDFWFSYASPIAVFSSVNAEASALYNRMQYLSSLGEARLILVSGLLGLVVVKVAKNAGLLFLSVWGYGWYRKWLRLERENLIVMLFAFIGVLTLVGLVSNRFFLSSRYTVLTALFLSLISFQYVDCLLRRLLQLRMYKWHAFGWAVIVVMFLDGIISGGATKENIRVAGEWVREEILPGSKIACNETRLAYYSGGACEYFELGDADVLHDLQKLRMDGYDYVLLWISRRNKSMQWVADNEGTLNIVREFINKKGDRVAVYQLGKKNAEPESIIK